MILTMLMFIVALCLSAVAAFYSIVGLTAIFAAAATPILIMGGILEVAKLVVTVWLHEYWTRCKLTMKLYLVPAVAVLMLITSMGIFGFLSKAHLDQAVPAGDIAAKVTIFDDKIKTERDNIEAARAALKQMDAQVDQVLGRTDDAKGAERAVQIRRQQARERNRLQQEISQAQARIVQLQEQRAPVAAEVRKVEAEVGPIKYVAALIYGDNPDNNLLEKAVRWMIILIVAVFDPLAIMMLLAATESLRWNRESQETQNATISNVATDAQDLDGHDLGSGDNVEPLAEALDPEQPRPRSEPIANYKILEEDDGEHGYVEPPARAQRSETWFNQEFLDQLTATPAPQESVQSPAPIQDEVKRLADGYVSYQGKSYSESAFKSLFPGLLPQADDLGEPPHAGFGTQFPTDPVKGDVFLRVDYLPTKLFKWNGSKWIDADKIQNQSYAYQNEYIDYLIRKISSGEYDPELLTDIEKELIAQQLRDNNDNQ